MRETMNAAATALASTVAGCFKSAEQVQLNADSQSVSRPRDYAYALFIKGDKEYHFTQADFEKLKATIKAQWAKYAPKDGKQSQEYQDKINALITDIAKAQGKIGSAIQLSLDAPILVRFDESNSDRYLVTSIRKRTIHMGSDSYTSIAVDASGILFKEGALVRLSFVRELTQEADIESAMAAMRDWAEDIRRGPAPITSK